MKKLFLLLSLVIASVASMNAFDRTFKINGNIKALEAAGNVKVVYTVGPKVSVVATTEQDFMQYVKVSLKNGKLSVGYWSDKGNAPDAVVRITAPALASYEASGNAKLEVKSPVKAGNLKASAENNATLEFDSPVDFKTAAFAATGNSTLEVEEASKGGSLKAESHGNATLKIEGITLDKLTASTEGNSTFKVEGSANTASFTSAGNSEIKAGSLSAGTGTVDASGNSTIKCKIAQITGFSCSGNASIKNK